MPHLIVPFALASVLLFLTPGPSMTLILATGASRGTRAGLLTVLGNTAGCAVLLAIVLAGLEVLVQNFESWFPYVRYLGAAYLFWLGLRFLTRVPASTAAGGEGTGVQPGGQFLNGVVVAFANPAALAFMAAFLPQFIDPGRNRDGQFLWLAATFLAASVLVQSVLAIAADRASRWLVRGNEAIINRVAAVVLLLGGLLLLFARG